MIGQDGAVVCVRHGGTWVKVMVKVRSYLRLRTEMELMNNKPLLTIQKVPQTFGKRHNLTDVADNKDHDDDAAEDPTSVDSDMDDSGTGVLTGVETETHQVEVLGRAGKATGQYKNWYNLLHFEQSMVAGKTDSVDVSKLNDLQIKPFVMTTDNSEDVLITKDVSFDIAKQGAIKNWSDNKVFEVVQDK